MIPDTPDVRPPQNRRPGRPGLHTAPITVSLYLPRKDAHTLQDAADRRTGGNLSAYFREIAAYLRAKEAERTRDTATPLE